MIECVNPSPRVARLSSTRCRIGIGAGDGNRTRTASLEDWSSTIELHPRGLKIISQKLKTSARRNITRRGTGQCNSVPTLFVSFALFGPAFRVFIGCHVRQMRPVLTEGLGPAELAQVQRWALAIASGGFQWVMLLAGVTRHSRARARD